MARNRYDLKPAYKPPSKRERQKRDAVLEWLRQPGPRHVYCDVLDRDFVDFFVAKTKCSIYPMPYGADKCPELGGVLSRMWRDRELNRSITGLDGMAGMGFPRWVYSYQLPPKEKS